MRYIRELNRPEMCIPLYLMLTWCSPSSSGTKRMSYLWPGVSRISHASILPLGDVRNASMSSGCVPAPPPPPHNNSDVRLEQFRSYRSHDAGDVGDPGSPKRDALKYVFFSILRFCIYIFSGEGDVVYNVYIPAPFLPPR